MTRRNAQLGTLKFNLNVDRYAAFESHVVGCCGGIYSAAYKRMVEDILDGWKQHRSEDRKSLVLFIPTDAVYCNVGYVPRDFRSTVHHRMRARGHRLITLSELFEIIDTTEARHEFVTRFLDDVRRHIPEDCGLHVVVSANQSFQYRETPVKGREIHVFYDGIRAVDGSSMNAQELKELLEDPAGVKNRVKP